MHTNLEKPPSPRDYDGTAPELPHSKKLFTDDDFNSFVRDDLNSLNFLSYK